MTYYVLPLEGASAAGISSVYSDGEATREAVSRYTGQLLKPLGGIEDIVLRGGSLQRLKWQLRHIFHPHTVEERLNFDFRG